MDQDRFDQLARALGSGRSRRSLVKGLGAAALGAAGLARFGGAEAASNKNSACAKFCAAVFGADTVAAGQCTSQAAQGTGPCLACGNNPANYCSGTCVNVTTDVANCGSCGHVCPSDACNTATCAAGVCGATPLTGPACNADNDACTYDTCQAGTCVAGPPKDCAGLNDQCNDGACDPATGQCQKLAKSNGTTCDDGNACTQTDTCQNGACMGGNPVVCAAPDQCHQAGVCNPTTGVCEAQPLADGTDCNADNDACTHDTCQAGACVPGAPKDCATDSDANDQCNTGVCDPSTGQCVKQPATDGTSCNADDNRCTENDTCQGGVCTPGTAVACPDRGPCFVNATCDSVTGDCAYDDAPSSTTCSAGDENCVGGVCCPAAQRCPTEAGDVCCSSGQACATFDALGMSIGICCDAGSVACPSFNGTQPALVCCPSGQACAPVTLAGTPAGFPLGACCDAGATACPSFDSSTNTIQVTCCPSGQACAPVTLGTITGFPTGICCDSGAVSCPVYDPSTNTIETVCCPAGVSCLTHNLFAGSAGICCNGVACSSAGGLAALTDVTCCESGNCAPLPSLFGGNAGAGFCCPAGESVCIDAASPASLSNPTYGCCAGAACHSLSLGGESLPVCCPDGDVPYVNVSGGSIACASSDACPVVSGGSITPTVCPAGTSCSTITVSGTTAGACCPAGQAAAVGGSALICCDNASVCGANPPVCCASGQACVTGACQAAG